MPTIYELQRIDNIRNVNFCNNFKKKGLKMRLLRMRLGIYNNRG